MGSVNISQPSKTLTVAQKATLKERCDFSDLISTHCDTAISNIAGSDFFQRNLPTNLDFSNPQMVPAMPNVTEADIKNNWLGQMLYIGAFRVRGESDYISPKERQDNHNGRCRNIEMSVGFIYKFEKDYYCDAGKAKGSKLRDCVFMCYPGEQTQNHNSLQNFALDVKRGFIFRRDWLETNTPAGLQVD